MVTYGGLIYFFFIPTGFAYSDPTVPWRILGLLFTSTVLIPLTAILFMWRMGVIKSMRIEDQRERNWPLLVTALIYFGSFYLTQQKGIPDFIQLLGLGATLGILISLGINLAWKISLHMIGVGGLCGGVVAITLLLHNGNVLLPVFVFLAAGMLGTARLHLQAHSPAQVFTGFITGFAVQFGLMMVLLL
jgi:hypothetical protein